jgi:hypothetical protein
LLKKIIGKMRETSEGKTGIRRVSSLGLSPGELRIKIWWQMHL